MHAWLKEGRKSIDPGIAPTRIHGFSGRAARPRKVFLSFSFLLSLAGRSQNV
jgi:hypothetical protein